MNKIAMPGKIALLTAIILGMSYSAAPAIESVWQGSAQVKTMPYEQQLVVDWNQQYTNHDLFDGWGGGLLGGFTGEGAHTIFPDLTLNGQATWVCADGASLFVSYAGRIIITEDRDFPYLFTAVLTAKGGTGRLLNAAGSANMNGRYSGTLDSFSFDFVGSLDTHANFHESGLLEMESLACAKGMIVPYAMDGWNPIMGTTHHSGMFMPTSEPVVEISVPGMIICRFTAEQGPNANCGMPLHVIEFQDGQIFCRWEAQCRLEINLDNYGETRLFFDGCYTVVGGTGRYQNACGTGQIVFETEPCFGDGPVMADYEITGTLQLDTVQSDSTNLLFNSNNRK